MFELLVMLAMAGTSTSAPAFDETIPGDAIKANIQRIGRDYRVEYTLIDEKLAGDSEAIGDGFHIRKLIENPVKDEKRECSFQEDLQGLRCHYKEIRNHMIPLELKYDGMNLYRRMQPTIYEKNVLGLRSDGQKWLRYEEVIRNMRWGGIFTPMVLLFPHDGFVNTLSLGPYPELRKKEDAYVGKNLFPTRFIRTKDGFVDIGGVKTIQYDREMGWWRAKLNKTPEELGTERSDWEFTRQGVYDRWWLDPEHNYLPVRVDCFLPRTEEYIQMRTEVSKFKLVAPNTWFPVVGTITQYGPVGKYDDKSPPESWLPIHRTTLEVTRVEVGKSFSDEDFKPLPDEDIRDETTATKPAP